MLRYLLAVALVLLASNADARFPRGASIITADWIRDVTAAPYSAACNGSANDQPAFASFMTDAQAQSVLGNSVMMVIPSGKACVISSGTAAIGRGVKNFTLYAYGASITNAGTGTILFGGVGQRYNNAFSVRLATANAGDSCVAFQFPTPSPAVTVSNVVVTGGTYRLTVSDTSAFSTGQILRVSGVVAGTGITSFLNGLQFMTVVSPGVLDVQNPSNLQPMTYGSGGLINDYTGLFSVDQYVLIGGEDVQAIYRSGGYGAPSNPAVYEYAKIASINLAIGQICFTAPLTNTYKSTWPNYDVGGNFGPDPGGGATLWSLDPSWDTDFRIFGLTNLSPSGQTSMAGRSVYAQDITDTGTPSMFVSQAGSFVGVNYSATGSYEIDKINGPWSCTGCALNIMHVQSRSSSTLMTITNSTVTQLNGTPANIVLNNVNIPTQLGVGPAGYGTSSSFVGSNVTTPTFSYISVGNTALQAAAGWSISGDTISIVQSTVTSYPSWAVEGGYVCFYGTGECEDIAKIVEIGQAGGSTTIRLNKSYAGSTWPAVQGSNVNIRAHPMPSYTCPSCTGTAQMTGMQGAPAGTPVFSYGSQTYSGTLGSAVQPVYKMWGKITSFSMNVTNAGGGTTFLLSQFHNWPMQAPQFTAVSSGWNSAGGGPLVNAAIGGNRTITLSGTYGIAGTQSGDAGWTAANPSVMWLSGQSNSGSKYNAAPSGCPGVGCPSVTVTIQTDQGIP